jgi:hypothetical protein
MRRCAALIAAYALALQALLSAFASPAAHALIPAVEICQAGIDADRAGEPAHGSCSACLAGHCASAATGPLRIASTEPRRRTVAAAPPAARAAGTRRPAGRHEPHAPRAPPLR